ncbi:hypothetical protein OXPF_06150 [Oxobacter pfennigii]|uniref:Uncharacterized protein n=1 Tax=Oxobacter pfennigii TaxID=36849 RepID=A0A0P8WB10_9CLOT|nr:pyocin knob domain-containing protein [Oxobacter pfennigii]KPU45826.1 hypothetical protein OXPF_06150 [Oxobacter pfennigii]
MQTTGNLGLKKPEGTDIVNIEDINDNMDILDTEIPKKVDKITGKGLSTEDYTTVEKNKLSGIVAGANNYTHPTNHPPSIISQDANNRFVTDAEKTAWNGKATLENVLMRFSGALNTTGTLDWNHSTNAQPGFSPTLLYGDATNGPSSAGAGHTYYHCYAVEYGNLKDGSGNITQFAIPYRVTSSTSDIYWRSRYTGAWDAWIKMPNMDDATKSNITLGLPGLFDNYDGDATFSSSSSFPRVFMRYRNLTINSGVTVNCTAGTIIIITGTLTLNGAISANGLGGQGSEPMDKAGGGAGGNGGGVVIILASKIVGSGSIRANGTNGANGVVPVGNSTPTNANGGSLFNPSILIPGGGTNNYNQKASANLDVITRIANQLYLWLNSDVVNSPSAFKGGGAGGAGRSVTNATDSYFSYGSCGGAGVGGDSGLGGRMASGFYSGVKYSFGGSGGGGGLIYLYSSSPIPALTLEAKGANGGTYYSEAVGSGPVGIGGSGGGGGLIYIISPSHSISTNVTGGIAGTSALGAGTSVAPTNGSAGVVISKTI